MADKKVCDICGNECKDNGRYELIYKCVIKVKKEDICYTCMSRIKQIIISEKLNL